MKVRGRWTDMAQQFDLLMHSCSWEVDLSPWMRSLINLAPPGIIVKD